jgi:hypothetical protein
MMSRFTRRDCDFLTFERGSRWSDALVRAAVGLYEPARGSMPAERSRDRLKRIETLSDLEAALVAAPASVVGVECEALSEEEFLSFAMRPAVENSVAVWVRLGTEGRRPTNYAIDWTWADTAASIAACDRLWRLRRRVLERLPQDAVDPLTEILRALPWPAFAQEAAAAEPPDERIELK